jgi:hypothetical protein
VVANAATPQPARTNTAGTRGKSSSDGNANEQRAGLARNAASDTGGTNIGKDHNTWVVHRTPYMWLVIGCVQCVSDAASSSKLVEQEAGRKGRAGILVVTMKSGWIKR